MNLVFKALSDPTRRQILQLLRRKPMNAGELAEHFAIAKSTLSAHFAILREADLIEAHKSGTVITYMLKVSVLEEALLAGQRVMTQRVFERVRRVELALGVKPSHYESGERSDPDGEAARQAEIERIGA